MNPVVDLGPDIGDSISCRGSEGSEGYELEPDSDIDDRMPARIVTNKTLIHLIELMKVKVMLVTPDEVAGVLRDVNETWGSRQARADA